MIKEYPPCLDYPKPRCAQTRADRIRAMSNEELAYALYHFGESPFCRDLKECGEMLNQDIEIPEEKCIACALHYLQEVAT